ncbi:MAG: fatty acid desaturase [Hyphomicrobiales bacterium]
MSTEGVVRASISLRAVEWKTLGLVILTYAAFAALTWYWAEIPLWSLLPLGGFAACLHGSLCHEAAHGHPTRIRGLNSFLVAFSPIVWVPYLRYRKLHLKHHNDDRLTDPFDDPESWFLTPKDFGSLTDFERLLLNVNNTSTGRLIIGPVVAFIRFAFSEARLLLKGNAEVAAAWGWHLLAVASLLYWVLVICQMPFVVFLVCFVWAGTSLTLMRSYAEHRAHEDPKARTAVVETNPLISLMFLNNNLHVVHHDNPQVAWYNLPQIYRSGREEFLKANKGYLINGYGRLLRKFFIKPHQPIAHPLMQPPQKKPAESDATPFQGIARAPCIARDDTLMIAPEEESNCPSKR